MSDRAKFPEYSTARYQRARAAVLAGNPACHWGCGRLATTADHVPPLAETGVWHWNLVPACRKCNFGRKGATPIFNAGSASREW